MPLDPDQRHAADWAPTDSSALTISAGAGSGKTHTLAALVEALVTPRDRATGDGLQGKGTDPSTLVVATFARNAAQELKTRLSSRLPATVVDQVTIGTFHALAGRALRSYEAWRWDFGRNLDGGDRTEGVPAGYQLWRAVLGSRQLPAGWHPKQAFGVGVSGEPDRYSQAVDLLRANGAWYTGRAAGTIQLPSFQAAWRLYEECKRHGKWWDYADLLSGWRFALIQAARTEGKVPAGLQGAGEDNTASSGTNTPTAAESSPQASRRIREVAGESDHDDRTVSRARALALRGGRIVIVDEAQDNNRIQLDLARLLARGDTGRVVLIGDERQTVHGWRGADPSLFLTGLPGTEHRPIRRNYRSTPVLVGFANEVQSALLGFGSNGKTTDVATLVAGKPHSVVWGTQQHHAAVAARSAVPDVSGVTARSWGVAPDEAADAVLADVLARHARGAPLAAHTVLCRTNASVALFEQAAVRAGVPVALTGAQPFWSQSVPEAVLAYSRLIGGDYASALKLVWNRPLRYLPAALADRTIDLVATGRAESFAEAVGQLVYEARGKTAKTLHELARLLDDLRRAGWPAGLDLVQRTLGASARAADQTARQSANSGEADTHEAELQAAIIEARRHPTPKDLLTTVVTAARRQDEDTADRLTISTIHRYKGREAPVVYYWAPKGEAPRGGSRDEEACLFYVACTRARDELHLVWSAYGLDGTTPTGPGAFLRLPGLRHRVAPNPKGA